MTAPTHIVFAVLSVQGHCLLLGQALHPALFVSAMLTSILPDIDVPESALGRVFRPLSVSLFQRYGHRTITHSGLAVMIAALLFSPLLLLTTTSLYIAALVGYLSHLIIDMNNTEGIALTYPLKHRWIFPASTDYRLKVGAKGEGVLRGVLMALACGVTVLSVVQPRSILHRIMGTPTAASAEYYQQLLLHHKVEVEISGVWTQRQSTLTKERFEVIAADNFTIYVRRYDDATTIYAVSNGPQSSISHARIKPKRSVVAEQRIVAVRFDHEKFYSELVLKYPHAVVSGQLTVTTSVYPTFDVDEFQTIRCYGERWIITHCPIERLSSVLGDSRIEGTLYLRYWKTAERNE